MRYVSCFYRPPPSLYFHRGGLSILPLIAMAATSCKRHSIVRKTSPFDYLGDPAQTLVNKHASHVWSLNRLWDSARASDYHLVRSTYSLFHFFLKLIEQPVPTLNQ
jgi:hypothetical protein